MSLDPGVGNDSNAADCDSNTVRKENKADINDSAVIDSTNISDGNSSSSPGENSVHDDSSDDDDDTDDNEDNHSDSYQYLDLSDILKLEIENGEYTCLICTGEIGITSKIWSCTVCYRVYDLDCIKGWSKRGISLNGEWKCPSCNSPNQTKTEQLEYRCWCGKVPDPYYNGHIPHSCGQTCNYSSANDVYSTSHTKGCVHGCPSVCHPGPHAECTAIGPSLPCSCGKHKRQWPCVITPYESGWQCPDMCQERMPCGVHKCMKKCHTGLCGKCEATLLSICYCGRTEVAVLCADRRPELCQSADLDTPNTWTGFFSCDKPCGQKLSCGVHSCSKSCHVSTPDSHICPTMPNPSEKCLCGKTLVSEILGRERQSCEEPIPACNKPCGKLLECGEHRCPFTCHEGTCVPCFKSQAVQCRCGRQQFDMPCKSVLAGERATCRRKCAAQMDCRRHRCGEVCCEYEKVSAEHERQRKRAAKAASLMFNEFGDLSLAEQDSELRSLEHPYAHVCTLPCDRVLSCKKHKCVEKCHHGACAPCLEASFDDYICPCGRTTVSAPIRCGSLIPTCHFSCPIARPCGHDVGHDCHDTNEKPCPPCLTRVEKSCDCGRTVVKGVLCSQEKVSCGRACGKALPCGHLCPAFCHTGECDTACTQSCGRLLPCGHKHNKPCHLPRPCDPSECSAPALDRCPCGHRRRQRKCQEKLEPFECDESCTLHLRNKLLAQALGVDVSIDRSPAARFSFNDDLLDLYYADPQWSSAVESQILGYLKKPDESPTTSSLRLPPMNSQRRMFVHLYAEECQLQSYSEDTGPNRSVVLMKTIRSAAPPARLSDFVKI